MAARMSWATGAAWRSSLKRLALMRAEVYGFAHKAAEALGFLLDDVDKIVALFGWRHVPSEACRRQLRWR